MARTAKITLDGQEYTVHALNLKELQEVGEIIDEGTANITVGMKVLNVALRRAEPPVKDVLLLEPTLDEINKATSAVLKLAGIVTDEKDPQAAAPATS